MDSKKIIDFIELKDEYACALLDYYLDRMDEDKITENLPKLQQYADNVCESWAKNFISMYRDEFADREVQIAVFRHFDSLGVKQGHTGKRFSEALYKQLHLFVQNKEQLAISK